MDFALMQRYSRVLGHADMVYVVVVSSRPAAHQSSYSYVAIQHSNREHASLDVVRSDTVRICQYVNPASQDEPMLARALLISSYFSYVTRYQYSNFQKFRSFPSTMP